MARSPVTNVINAFNSLTEDEKKLCLDFIAPEPEPDQPVKKPRKKRTTKSPKAQSLESVIKSSHEAKSEAALVLDGTPCTAKVPGLDVVCGETADRLIHDPNGGYAGYHPFSLVAPAVEPKPSRKNKGTKASESSIPSSETPLVVVGDAALAVSAGD